MSSDATAQWTSPRSGSAEGGGGKSSGGGGDGGDGPLTPPQYPDVVTFDRSAVDMTCRDASVRS